MLLILNIQVPSATPRATQKSRSIDQSTLLFAAFNFRNRDFWSNEFKTYTLTQSLDCWIYYKFSASQISIQQ